MGTGYICFADKLQSPDLSEKLVEALKMSGDKKLLYQVIKNAAQQIEQEEIQQNMQIKTENDNDEEENLNEELQQPAESKSDEIVWRCQQCGFDNTNKDNECVICSEIVEEDEIQNTMDCDNHQSVQHLSNISRRNNNTAAISTQNQSINATSSKPSNATNSSKKKRKRKKQKPPHDDSIPSINILDIDELDKIGYNQKLKQIEIQRHLEIINNKSKNNIISIQCKELATIKPELEAGSGEGTTKMNKKINKLMNKLQKRKRSCNIKNVGNTNNKQFL